MADSLDPFARHALTETLKEKVQRLVADQARLAEERARLLAMQRRNDRELSDCRAAARLFDLEIDIPVPMPDELSLREREAMELDRRRRVVEAEQRRAAALADAARETRETSRTSTFELLRQSGAITAIPAPAPAPLATPAATTLKPPPVKAFLAKALKEAGATGAKAAPLREAYARAYGIDIHEKTVGMTLYRMANDGLVRRDGHTWFLAEAPNGAEAENPGAATPGSDNALI